MARHIFRSETELENIPEAAPRASLSFSVSEKLARYGSSALSGVEHLTLLVGKESVALALIRRFVSLKALARASFQELRQFLPRRKAEAVVVALSMSAIAETEHARSEQLDNPESISCLGNTSTKRANASALEKRPESQAQRTPISTSARQFAPFNDVTEASSAMPVWNAVEAVRCRSRHCIF